MTTVLVTGGSGFIGKNLCAYLEKEGYTVLAPGHAELELTDTRAVATYFASHEIDTVVHAANRGGSRKGPVTGIALDNLKIFLNLVVNNAYYNRMIFLGSGAEYDSKRDLNNVSETELGEHIPEDEYGVYKYTCSQIIASQSNIVNLRIFGIYGEHEDYEIRFISNMICRMLHDLPLEMHQNRRFDFVYVQDICRIIHHFIEHKPNQKMYNVGTGQHTDLQEVLSVIQNVAGNTQQVTIAHEGLSPAYTCDASLLIEELGDFTFTPLEKGVRAMFAWYKEKNVPKENLRKH